MQWSNSGVQHDGPGLAPLDQNEIWCISSRSDQFLATLGYGEISMSSVGRIPFRLKASWGLGALGVAVLMNSGSFLVLTYLITVVKLSPVLAGTIMLVVKIFDAVSDPVMGIISDRSNFKSGRRRPYLFIGTFLSTIAFGLLFTMPVFEAQVTKALYAFGVLLLYTIGYTVFNVPYMAMSAEMTDDYEERTSLHGMRAIFVSIGSSIVSAGTPLLLQILGRDWDAYAAVGIVLSAVIFAAMITCWLGTGEARTFEHRETGHNFLAQLGLLGANRHFLIIALTKLLQLLAVMSGAAVSLIFFMDYLQMNLGYLTIMGLFGTIITIIAVPMITRLSAIIGKRNTYVVSALLTMGGYLSWALLPAGFGTVESQGSPVAFLPPGLNRVDMLVPLLWRAALFGIVIGGNVMMAMSMLMDAIEFDARKTGMRREGVYSACYSFVEKFSSSFGPFLIGVILQFTGYNNEVTPGSVQSVAALDGIRVGMSVLPAMFTGLSIVALMFYTLDKTKLAAVAAQPAAE
jgi:GPH family glycoside/pentoside/hexuronide:cation symporter